jgi:hypothetical protein
MFGCYIVASCWISRFCHRLAFFVPIDRAQNRMTTILRFSNPPLDPGDEPRSGPRIYYKRLKEMVSAHFGKIAIGPLRVVCAVFFLVLISTSCCFAAAEIVFVHSLGGSSTEQEQLQIATDFYGLNLNIIQVAPANDGIALSRAVEREETVGVVIAANALGVVNLNALLRALHGRGGSSVPLLILGVAPDVDAILLRTWSGGTALGCKRLESTVRSQYMFGRVDGLTWQLADLEIPLHTRGLSYLELAENSPALPIASVRHDDLVSPVFIETTVQQEKVFVASAVSLDERLMDGEGVVSAFLQIAPEMMFVRSCARERGWHALHYYANLTIDDPWLRQPYGYVDYKGLLDEMERHSFHTTIAFIPWNYDRSDQAVVSLFRNHPERFSISVHGDNHDHKEFTDYQSKPLANQIADLKQSLARMEKFRALTGIPYDKVMVFPHTIAPEETLEALKTYNYLATINSVNVPQNAERPADPLFALRPVTLSFADFPSIRRYSVTAPILKAYVAINEFLGNPLFFYGHSEDFAGGIAAFDGTADEVNELEPDTQWRGLGEIVRHLYLVKLRDDSNYDVLAFSSSICLDNASGRDSVFYVRKQENGTQAINSLIVDGQNFPYQLQDGYLNFRIPVSMGKTRCAAIQYQNDLDLASVGTSRHSVVVYLLRMASDFRDNYMSKVAVGLAFVRFYNEHKVTPTQVLGCAFSLILVFLYAGYRLRVFVTKKRAG